MLESDDPGSDQTSSPYVSINPNIKLIFIVSDKPIDNIQFKYVPGLFPSEISGVEISSVLEIFDTYRYFESLFWYSQNFLEDISNTIEISNKLELSSIIMKKSFVPDQMY